MTEALHQRLQERTLVRALQEILRRAASEARYSQWRSFFSELWCYVPADPVGTHIAAAQLRQACRRGCRIGR
jgi:hypothetical protein